MRSKSYLNLRAIRFQGELLPNWTQLLDVASRFCPVPEETRDWFSKLTNRSGVDDSRTILDHCECLRACIQQRRPSLVAELRRGLDDRQPAVIFNAWIYALDTMIQQARGHKTCCWIIDGTEPETDDGSEGGEITLRRI